jgi:LemA protein
MSGTVIVLIVLGLIALFVIYIYNSLVRAKVRTDEAWSDITVQLKRRYDLIPNLVNTVKGYAKHEKTVFEDVTEARAQALNAQTVTEAAKADNQFQAALKSLFAVAEAYPDLKANQSFQQLQAELVDTEDKIQASRRFYNGAARDLNVKIQTFPTNIFAGMLGFKIRDFFDVDAGEAEAVSKPVGVDFSDDSKPKAK